MKNKNKEIIILLINKLNIAILTGNEKEIRRIAKKIVKIVGDT